MQKYIQGGVTMDSRALAALLSSLTSTLVSLLLFIISLPNNNNPNPLSLLQYSSNAATASLSLLPRKRKRTEHSPSPNSPQLCPSSIQLGGLGRVDSFKLTFKMTRSTFEWLAGLLEPLLDCRDPADSQLGLLTETRLGIGLFRLGTGAGYGEISNRFGVSEPVARFCTKQLCRVLCTNFRFWVGFGDTKETVAHLEIPNCCGVISTTTFEFLKIDKTFRNGIKTQIVVDSSCRILGIFAGFRGDRSDFMVLKASTLYNDIEERRILNKPCVYIHNVAIPQFLIGDGDYPLLPWLITPFVDPIKGSCEDCFNLEINSIRGSLIRAISSLRNWGVLSKPIEGGIRDAVSYIGACSILHNGLLMREDYSALSEEMESFEGFKDRILWDSLDEKEGSVIRMALATRAKVDS